MLLVVFLTKSMESMRFDWRDHVSNWLDHTQFKDVSWYYPFKVLETVTSLSVSRHTFILYLNFHFQFTFGTKSDLNVNSPFQWIPISCYVSMVNRRHEMGKLTWKWKIRNFHLRSRKWCCIWVTYTMEIRRLATTPIYSWMKTGKMCFRR